MKDPTPFFLIGLLGPVAGVAAVFGFLMWIDLLLNNPNFPWDLGLAVVLLLVILSRMCFYWFTVNKEDE